MEPQDQPLNNVDIQIHDMEVVMGSENQGNNGASLEDPVNLLSGELDVSLSTNPVEGYQKGNFEAPGENPF